MTGIGTGCYGCPLCNEPPPHGHHLATILNSLYYCPDGSRHRWSVPSRWLRRVHCTNCGERQQKKAEP